MRSWRLLIGRAVVLNLAVFCACGNAEPVAETRKVATGGVPCYAAMEMEYKPAGKLQAKIRMSEPVVIAVASRPERWGWFQFPGIARGEDGTLHAGWSMAADSVVSYGTSSGGRAISKDGGRTWTPYTGPAASTGLMLPNGDRIVVTTPKARKVSDLDLPAPVGEGVETYGKIRQPRYRLTELPPDLRVVHLNRMPKGQTKWIPEQALLDDPRALRYSTQGLFPIVWWGDLKVASDQSVIAGIYPGYRLMDDGTMDPKCGVFFYRSVDFGRSWKILSRIPYQPDMKADPAGDKRDGFTEPAFEILKGGECLCVLRTTDGIGIGPMYVSLSADMAKTWTKPEVMARSGVLPRLLRLDNGVVVLSSGRPGVQLRFNLDGRGKAWTEPFEMLPYAGGKDEVSCGYTSLLASGPDRFLLIYSDFKYPDKSGEPRKAIKVREIVVVPE